MRRINSKQDLKYFLEADKKALKRNTNKDCKNENKYAK